MKPIVHARNSVTKFGGKWEDYIAIHEEMDSSKSSHASVAHRVIFHTSFGIFLVEKIFGRFIINSEAKEVSVRDIAEQHVMEDLGFIPSLDDFTKHISIQPWMVGVEREVEPPQINLKEILDPLYPSEPTTVPVPGVYRQDEDFMKKTIIVD